MSDLRITYNAAEYSANQSGEQKGNVIYAYGMLLFSQEEKMLSSSY